MSASVTTVRHDAPSAPSRRRSREPLLSVLRRLVLVGAGLLFAAPLIASAIFGFTLPGTGFTMDPLLEAVSGSVFWRQLGLSLTLALLTALLCCTLLTLTLLHLHLNAPRLLPAAEALSVLPYVVPPVAMVTGVSLVFREIAPGFLVDPFSLVPFYVIITMPLVYRVLDTGVRAVDVQTLMSAGTSLGASRMRVIAEIILPNLRSALLTGALICAAMVLGEFVLASLLLHSTYPVFLAQTGQDNPRAAAALAFLTLIGTWLLLAGFTRTTRLGGKGS